MSPIYVINTFIYFYIIPTNVYWNMNFLKLIILMTNMTLHFKFIYNILKHCDYI